MPYFRHRSFVIAPASASLSTPMLCSSVNRRFFIRLLPDEQTLLHAGTNLGEQTTPLQPVPAVLSKRAARFSTSSRLSSLISSGQLKRRKRSVLRLCSSG